MKSPPAAIIGTMFVATLLLTYLAPTTIVQQIRAERASVRENRSVLTSRAGFMASTPFSVSQENSIRIAANVLFNRGRRGPALQRFDICGNRDWFNVFEVVIPSALRPGPGSVRLFGSRRLVC